MRSWIAITLVISLITFCAFTFAVNDSTLRNTLIGGIIASSGSAVAFYFASRSADQARQDILSAALGKADSETVPSLHGKAEVDALKALGASFGLAVASGSDQDADAKITDQDPKAGKSAPKGSWITVTLKSPSQP